MFCFTPNTLLQVASEIAPSLAKQVEVCWAASKPADAVESFTLDKTTMAAIEDISLG